jgi:hypothetical protein
MRPSLIYKNEGKGWTFSETEFSKGSSGDLRSFLEPSKVRDDRMSDDAIKVLVEIVGWPN